MIHGERVKLAREKLGMDRMTFATVLDATQSYIANIENCKDNSKWLSSHKMQHIIDLAKLPAGYFFYSNDEFQEIVLGNNNDPIEVYAKLMRGGTMLDEELNEVLEIVRKLKDKT